MDSQTLKALAADVAESLWLLAFASAVERAIEDREPGARDLSPGQGGRWEDVQRGPAPARFIMGALEILRGLPPGILDSGRTAYRDLSGLDDERFAYAIAWEILGIGVRLEDDLPTYCDRGPLTMTAQRDAVLALSRCIPRRDCACEFHADYNSQLGIVE